MTDHKYKLTYYNGRGLAEIIRLVFAAAGQKYEDVRIEKDQWPALKDKTPFGQVPILEIDGKTTLAQSNAIAKYLAEEYGLAGKTPLDKARAHMIIECIADTLKPLFSLWGPDETKKAELMKKYVDEQLPKFLAEFEKLLKENNGGNGYFVGDALTWADLGFLSLTDWLKVCGAGGGDRQVANYEKLNGLVQRVSAQPKIAEWLAKRPDTPF